MVKMLKGCLMLVIGFIGLLLTFCGSLGGNGGFALATLIGTIIIVITIASIGSDKSNDRPASMPTRDDDENAKDPQHAEESRRNENSKE